VDFLLEVEKFFFHAHDFVAEGFVSGTAGCVVRMMRMRMMGFAGGASSDSGRIVIATIVS